MRIPLGFIPLVLACALQTTFARPPNIITINADDLGWTDLSIQGSTFYETPNIDQMAKDGAIFSNAYAASSNCVPSRACTMTGQYGPRHGIYTVDSSERGAAKDRKLIPTPNTVDLADEHITVAEVLQAAGYRTGHVGKWHLGADPRTQGFDINVGGGHWGFPPGNGYHSPYDLPNCEQQAEGEYLTDRLGIEAVRFIQAHHDQPFFLSYAPYSIHSPIQGKQELVAKYQQKTPSKSHYDPSYAAMVQSLDENVGRILNALKDLGIEEDTLVVFTSDNGGVWRWSQQKPLTAGKGSYTEGGIRVPLFARWPGTIQPGTICDTPVIGIDLFPTFLQAAGVETPHVNRLDGVSLMPLFTGSGAIAERALFWHFPIYLHGNCPERNDPLFRTRPGSVIRFGDWKLHEYFEDGTLELYNLKTDIGETNNLAQARPEKVDALHQLLKLWRAETNAPVPTERNPQYLRQPETPINMLNNSLQICLITGALACTTTSATNTVDEVAAATVDYFTDTGYGSPVATIQHPAGEFHEGVTYIAYQGLGEDPYVAAYNHDTKGWVGPYRAGVSDLGKDPNTKIDNHGRPALIIDDAGYIHVVFGGHGGMIKHGENSLGNTHLGTMKHVVTKQPLNISSWEPLDNIPPFGTYNQFVKMDNGDLYLFYRHGAHRSNWVYQKSNDNGRTFDPPVSILKTKRRDDMPANDAWYAWFKKGHGDEIIACYNYHLCKDEPHHDGERHNGYYMVMDTNDHIWRTVEGETLASPITKELADKKTLVVDTGDLWSVCGTAAIDSLGHPHVTFTTGEHLGLRHGGPKEINHYQWTGDEWSYQVESGLPVAVGDMDIVSPEHVRLLLGRKDKKKNGEVAWWIREKQGDRFTKEAVLLSLKKNGIVISSTIRNAHPDARVLAASKKGNTDYSKVYLIGDSGPLARLQVEAETLSAEDKAKTVRTKAPAKGK